MKLVAVSTSNYVKLLYNPCDEGRFSPEWNELNYLGTIDAALAKNGEFQRVIQRETKALEIAKFKKSLGDRVPAVGGI